MPRSRSRTRSDASAAEALVPVTPKQVAKQVQQLVKVLSELESSYKSSPTVARQAVDAARPSEQSLLMQQLLTMMEKQIEVANAPGLLKYMWTKFLNFLGLGMQVNTAQLMAISHSDNEIVSALLAELQHLQGNATPEGVGARREIMTHLIEVQNRRTKAIGQATWLPMILSLLLCGFGSAHLGASHGVPWK